MATTNTSLSLRRRPQFGRALAIGSLALAVVAGAAAAEGRGPKPSVARVGAGGGRPSFGGGAARPTTQRPAATRPAGGGQQRPSLGNASIPSQGARPQVAARPAAGGGGFNPSGGRTTVGFPATRPAGVDTVAKRPSVRPPSQVSPVNRPATLPGNLAGNGANGRPNGARPAPGGVATGGDRPNLGSVNRPATLPGQIDRPNVGPNRPGGERPVTLPGKPDRPTIGGDRPTTLPGKIDRPVTRPGPGQDRPIQDRPIIGGRPGQGSGRPITLPADLNRPGIGHRPSWDRPPGGWNGGNWNRSGWGLGGNWGSGHWHDHWHNHCIHHHHQWYNGCWHGGWGSYWYVPFAWTSVGWGLGAWTTTWGYGTGYYNPYYVAVAPTSTVYNYSQPVVVNNYLEDSADPAALPPEDSRETNAALAAFDEGLALFKSGDYRGAIEKFNRALEKLPGDAVIHETRALALFAAGDYNQAAMALNALLSSAPGMDWTTMSQLYGSVDDYTKQLRALEGFCGEHGQDAAAHFVLAYHYLVTGEQEAAITALTAVVKQQPKDATAKRLLDALVAERQAAAAPPAAAANPPEIDLVGKWRATAGQTTIDLSVSQDSQFVWKAAAPGQSAAELAGQLVADGDALSLVNEQQGDLSGKVQVESPEQWRFTLLGAPPSDAGLEFHRVK